MDVFFLSIPPFMVRLETNMASVVSSVNRLYRYSLQPNSGIDAFYDFHIRISPPSGIRHFLRPQAQFYFDGKTPFNPLPFSQAYPFFEWGLNWCIATHIYQYLILHAAVVEKNGKALILPGQPGAGKSTLCAALVLSGWRLLSDEMAVIEPGSLELIPVVRPVSLKNESIQVIADHFPEAEFGESFHDTAKGTVAHMMPPRDSFDRNTQQVKVAWIVFPTFKSGAVSREQDRPRGETVIELAKNSFNYGVLGGRAFDMLCDLVASSRCGSFEYSRISDAVAFFDSLAQPQ